ncbi:unnamed protein product, partial [Choristocarpus tenellus]
MLSWCLRREDNVTLLKEAEKEAVIGAHFAAGNWIRELANAYVVESDPESKVKASR